MTPYMRGFVSGLRNILLGSSVGIIVVFGIWYLPSMLDIMRPPKINTKPRPVDGGSSIIWYTGREVFYAPIILNNYQVLHCEPGSVIATHREPLISVADDKNGMFYDDGAILIKGHTVKIENCTFIGLGDSPEPYTGEVPKWSVSTK